MLAQAGIESGQKNRRAALRKQAFCRALPPSARGYDLPVWADLLESRKCQPPILLGRTQMPSPQPLLRGRLALAQPRPALNEAYSHPLGRQDLCNLLRVIVAYKGLHGILRSPLNMNRARDNRDRGYGGDRHTGSHANRALVCSCSHWWTSTGKGWSSSSASHNPFRSGCHSWP